MGAALMILSGAGYTVHLALAKEITADLHPIYLAFWRSFIALLCCFPFILFGRIRVTAARFPALLSRSIIGSAGFVFGLLAIWPVFALPLADFNALSFTRPLFVAILAVLLLGEKVGLHRTGALMAGFAGIIVMTLGPDLFGGTRPAPLNWGSGFALMSAVCFAGAIVLMKSLSGLHSPAALLVWANLLSSILILPAALFFWGTPDAASWGLIIAMAVTGLISQFCFISAIAMGEASFLAPMDYLRLPMAAAADWVMIRLLPGPFVWAGAVIIVASTLYITLREARLNRRSPVEPPKPV